MRRVSEATGVRTGHMRKQASQTYAEEGLDLSTDTHCWDYTTVL